MSETTTRQPGTERTVWRRSGATASWWSRVCSTRRRSRRISAWTDELRGSTRGAGPVHDVLRAEPAPSGRARAPADRELLPVPCRLRGPVRRRQAARLRVPALRRAGRPLQGQDQLQAARAATASSPIKTSRRAGAPTPTCSSPRWSASMPPPRRTAAWSWPPGTTRADSSAKSGSRSPPTTCAAWTPVRCRPRPATSCSSIPTRRTPRRRTSPASARRVLYITYNRRSAGDHRVRYYADKRKSFPPDIERDPTRTYTFRV